MYNTSFNISRIHLIFKYTWNISQNRSHYDSKTKCNTCKNYSSYLKSSLIMSEFNCHCCSVAQSCPSLCDSMDCNMPVFPVLLLLEFDQIHVHWIRDAIQPSHPLPSSSPPAFNLSQHQGLFQWVSSSHQVAEVLELQLQH